MDLTVKLLYFEFNKRMISQLYFSRQIKFLIQFPVTIYLVVIGDEI